jgi:hypothetical protein
MSIASTRSLILVLALSLVAHFSQAQDDAGKWTLGAALGAGVSYRSLVNTDNSQLATTIITQRNELESPILVSSASLQVGYRLSDRLTLEGGIGYVQFGWTSSFDLTDLTFGDQIDPRRGFVYNTGDALPATWTLNDRFHYLEIPLGLAMLLGNGRWRSSSTLGIAPAFLLSARGTTVSNYPDGRQETENYDLPQDFATFNLIPYFSTGLGLHPGANWHWHFRPTVRYGALLITDTPVSGRLYSVSLDVGVHYTL